jgi:hypothetical protein
MIGHVWSFRFMGGVAIFNAEGENKQDKTSAEQREGPNRGVENRDRSGLRL